MICSQAWGEALGPLSPTEPLRSSSREEGSPEAPSPAQVATGEVQGTSGPPARVPHWACLKGNGSEVRPFSCGGLAWTGSFQLSDLRHLPTTLGLGHRWKESLLEEQG